MERGGPDSPGGEAAPVQRYVVMVISTGIDDDNDSLSRFTIPLTGISTNDDRDQRIFGNFLFGLARKTLLGAFPSLL